MFIVPQSETLKLQPSTSIPCDWVSIPYRVQNKWLENKNLVTISLEPVGTATIEAIAPGQFNMLYTYGVGEIPISVSSLDDHPTLVHTIQGVGAVSNAICQLNIGDQLGVRGPFGTTWPIEEALFKDVLIMAGGVGFAPLRPMIQKIASHRENFGEVNFLYGTRDPESLFFHKDIISLQSDTSINFQVTVDHTFSNWRGNVGVVTSLIEKATFDPLNTVAFVCGPEVMMRYGAYSLLDAGIPEDQIHLSMERNMKCAVGHCGHCQFGPYFICKDGPVFSYPKLQQYLNIRGI
ncbi:MAG: FAD/NAD(P)-binding protein [Cyclobacteriaceae bacterium]